MALNHRHHCHFWQNDGVTQALKLINLNCSNPSYLTGQLLQSGMVMLNNRTILNYCKLVHINMSVMNTFGLLLFISFSVFSTFENRQLQYKSAISNRSCLVAKDAGQLVILSQCYRVNVITGQVFQHCCTNCKMGCFFLFSLIHRLIMHLII